MKTLYSQILSKIQVNIREKDYCNSNSTEMIMKEFVQIQKNRMKEENEKAKQYELNLKILIKIKLIFFLHIYIIFFLKSFIIKLFIFLFNSIIF